MIDRSKLNQPGLWFDILRTWDEGGHEVALIDKRNANNPECGGPELECECDYDYEIKEKDGIGYKVSTKDSRKCPAKEAVRRKVIKESQEKYGEHWKKIGLKEAVFEIFQKVESKEYLGQHNNGIIYLLEAAELLDVEPYHKLLKECGELRIEKRMGLSGDILTHYEEYFHFPAEINQLLAHLVMRQPADNACESGERFLIAIGRAISDATDYEGGKETFCDDYPCIQPATLEMFGRMWARKAFEKLNNENAEFARENKRLKKELEKMKARAEKAEKFWGERQQECAELSMTLQNEKLKSGQIEAKILWRFLQLTHLASKRLYGKFGVGFRLLFCKEKDGAYSLLPIELTVDPVGPPGATRFMTADGNLAVFIDDLADIGGRLTLESHCGMCDGRNKKDNDKNKE